MRTLRGRALGWFSGSFSGRFCLLAGATGALVLASACGADDTAAGDDAGANVPTTPDATALPPPPGAHVGSGTAAADAAAPGDAGPDAPSAPTTPGVTVVPLDTCSWRVVLDASVFELDLFEALGSPTCRADIQVSVPENVTVGSNDPSRPAFTMVGFAMGTTVQLSLAGRIVGAGGKGGSGGNGGSGAVSYCGRKGQAGGVALRADVQLSISVLGSLFGGGGGGGGASGNGVAVGGGGGAGVVLGAGGAGATSASNAEELAYCGQDNGVRGGVAGNSGTGEQPGPSATVLGTNGMACMSGAGGAFGVKGSASSCSGTINGGGAGRALDLVGGGSSNLAPGVYSSGTGPIRGAVVAP